MKKGIRGKHNVDNSNVKDILFSFKDWYNLKEFAPILIVEINEYIKTLSCENCVSSSKHIIVDNCEICNNYREYQAT